MLKVTTVDDTGMVRMLRSEDHWNVLTQTTIMTAAKATMGFLGVEVGPPRLPNQGLVGEQQARLRADLEELGFFEWLKG